MPPKRGGVRRPAARGAVLRRPARGGAEEEAAPREERVKSFDNVDLREVARMDTIAFPEAVYYGRKVTLAGHIRGLRCEGDQWFLEVEATGTQDEELLRILSGKRNKVMQVHVCRHDCGKQLTDELLIHSGTYEAAKLDEAAWMSNLKAVKAVEAGEDEMRELRLEQERMELAKKEKERKNEKKESKKRRREEKEEGRQAKSPKKDEEEMEVGQVALEEIFRDTGMDPNLRRRSRVLKRARKLAKRGKKGKKKKEKGSSDSSEGSSPSSSESSSLDVGNSGIFEDEKKLKTVWRKCPGALSSRSIQEIKANLLTSTGTAWDMNKAVLPPVYTQYARQVIMPRMGASLQQEVITVSQTLDLITRGRVAAAMDILNQRLKSLEALGRGSHWSLCRQYELIKTDEGGMTEEQEKWSAARHAREEDRLKNLMARPPSGKGGETSQGGKTRKGKDSKGSGKGQPQDAGKNRGGQGGRDEGKASWQKK